ncbi:hypothetical protein HMPREF9402_0393 [Turicibacter sp. HGF1]|uniref:DUF262 domain-containing protein n=1 Tax=Turicibacter sp. HGF1 TaxID=910310 RepID=UPI0001FDB303|nr:DUF262 domain-containing protein [Turicibacter sp. HGF1]EGC92761.1 hypothetical protein HMPREF9402_0393 [Turicibacter sp. HGF1]
MELIEIMKQIKNQELILPDFQRDFAWSKNQQKDLLSSILLGLPIGSILLLEGKDDDFSNKKIGYINNSEVPKEKCLYLLDGQQRLTTLYSSLNDLFCNEDEWVEVMKGVYNNLKTRLLLRMDTNPDEKDIFGYNELVFKESNMKKYEPTDLESRLIHLQIGYGEKKLKEWYNPGYIFEKGSNPLDTQNKVIEEYANLKCIPLNEFFNYMCPEDESLPMLKLILKKIATNRSDYLSNKYRRDNENTIKFLHNVEPNIETYLKLNNEREIDTAWRTLALSWVDSICNYFSKVLTMKVHGIKLKEDEVARAVIIFETLNRGGTKLSNFDLVVARDARNKETISLNNFLRIALDEELLLPDKLVSNIYHDIKPSSILISFMVIKDDKISEIIKKQFLNVLSIICEQKEMVKNSDVIKNINLKTDVISQGKILNLTQMQIKENRDRAIIGIKRACAFLQVRCGVTTIDELNYKLMILPLACTLMDDEIWEGKVYLDRLEAWYWHAIFSGQYKK